MRRISRGAAGLIGLALAAGCEQLAAPRGESAVAQRLQFDQATVMSTSAVAAPPPMAPAPAVPADQKLIRTGNIRIECGDVGTAVRRADSLAKAMGGFVADTRMNESDRGAKAADLVLRVPADRFDATMKALGALGRVRHQSANTEDVTRIYTDLEIRIAVKEETVTRLRSLLANRTARLSDVIDLERELGRAIAELEQMKGERRFYDQRIAMSSIATSLFEPSAPGLASVTDPVMGALRHAFETLGISLGGLVYLVFLLVPWLVVGIPATIWIRRRWARRQGRTGATVEGAAA